jgi:hypothetical protein
MIAHRIEIELPEEPLFSLKETPEHFAARGGSVPPPGHLDWLTILPVGNPYLVPLVTDLVSAERQSRT